MTLDSSVDMVCINSLRDKNLLLLVLLMWAHSCQFKQFLPHLTLVLMKDTLIVNSQTQVASRRRLPQDSIKSGSEEELNGARVQKLLTGALLSVLLHRPSCCPCCSGPMLTHQFPGYGSGPQLPPWLTDSPHYAGRQLP